MSSIPYIAMYPSDFLADIGHLGNTELGIYWRLLLVYYRDGRPLPFETDRLRRLAMTFSPEECRALDSVVSEFFVLTTEPEGTRSWHHRRADKEIERAGAYMDAKRGGAAKAREKLAAKRAESLTSELTSEQTTKLGSKLIPRGEPEPEPEKKHIRAVKARPTATPDGFAEFWEAWPNTDRRTNKKKCGEKWVRAGLEVKTAQIVAHVEAMKLTDKWKAHYEPAPMTYLNGEMWDDGVPEASAGDELSDIFARAL